jgi:hypothetical protein
MEGGTCPRSDGRPTFHLLAYLYYLPRSAAPKPDESAPSKANRTNPWDPDSRKKKTLHFFSPLIPTHHQAALDKTRVDLSVPSRASRVLDSLCAYLHIITVRLVLVLFLLVCAFPIFPCCFSLPCYPVQARGLLCYTYSAKLTEHHYKIRVKRTMTGH